MARIEKYQDLIAWQKAYALTLEVYRLTGRFPADERFGLTSQMRRAAVSIPRISPKGSADTPAPITSAFST
jgi:four helix bundle protein